LGIRGPKSKIVRTAFYRVPHGEMTAKKWLDSIEKQKRRINLKEQHDKQTYIQTDRVNDKKIIDSYLGAEINLCIRLTTNLSGCPSSRNLRLRSPS